FAQSLVRRQPSLFTERFAKAGREERILVDYLRNNRTNTSIAAYSARAKPDATVSVPLTWPELSPRKGPDRFTIGTVPRRLQTICGDTLSQFGVDLETLDPHLRLERIEAPLVSGGYAVGPIDYNLRLSISGDWELAFPSNTFDAWPNTPQPLDPQAKQFKF